MDQNKIGKFIAECRKNKDLTQEQLAGQLNLSSKTISKWECGNGLPDVSIMKDLCSVLGINLIDLLSGENTNTKYYIHRTEGSMVKKMTMLNAIKEISNTDSLLNNPIIKIQDIHKKMHDVTLEVIINGFDILETESFTKVMLEVSDETGDMTVMFFVTKNKTIKDMVQNFKIGQSYRMKGFVSFNEEVVGDKLMALKSIQKIERK